MVFHRRCTHFLVDLGLNRSGSAENSRWTGTICCVRSIRHLERTCSTPPMAASSPPYNHGRKPARQSRLITLRNGRPIAPRERDGSYQRHRKTNTPESPATRTTVGMVCCLHQECTVIFQVSRTDKGARPLYISCADVQVHSNSTSFKLK